MADEPIPFTTGPLADWPLVEEMIDKQIDRAVEAMPGKAEFINWARARVLEGAQSFFQAVQGQLTPQATFSSKKDFDAATRLFNEAVSFYKDAVTRALGERIEREVYIAKLEWAVEHGQWP